MTIAGEAAPHREIKAKKIARHLRATALWKMKVALP